ncbi:MAG TPA: sulfotransferase [Planctomycetaceae bacterium]|nr:sulfotransferase [Planctomycetaceae bacterium]
MGIRRWHRRLMAHALRKSVHFHRNGEPDKAFALLRRLARAVPSVPRAHLMLASACDYTRGDPRLAERSIRAAVAASRSTAGVLCRAASLHLAWRNVDKAQEILSAAHQRFPLSWRVWQSLGQLHLETGKFERAIYCFHKEIELAPSPKVWLRAMTDAARCYTQVGNKDEAVCTYRRIIDAIPTAAHAYWGLIQAGESLDGPLNIVDRIHELLRSANTSEEARQFCHYALGAVYDRAGQSAEAFAHFHLGNDLRAKTVAPLNVKALRQEVLSQLMIFDRERIANLAAHGCRNHFPICIVGMPRSGTTLVEQLLSSHSSVHALGERGDIWRLTKTIRWEVGSDRHYPECIEKLRPSAVRDIARFIAEQRNHVSGGLPRVTTKTPEDFWNLGLIYILFPNAKIVHCLRDPIDTCLSCYMQNFGEVPFATNLTQLAEVYRLYELIMTHWRCHLPRSSLWDISYEALLDRPVETVRDLCSFCDLDFEDACLNFHRNLRRVETASLWQVRKPFYKTSVQRWHRYREFLGPLLPLERDASQLSGSKAGLPKAAAELMSSVPG